jgi:ABC-type transport system substrate-binding protein
MIFDAAVIDEKGADWFLKESAGTGPFKFVHWKRGQEVKLAAHKPYWGGAPKIDGVNYLVVPSEDTAVSMFEAGELDILKVEANDLARRVMRDAKLRALTVSVPRAQITYLGLNQNRFAPFKDRRVREAFCLALDREAMSRGLFGGLATPLHGQVTPGIPGYNPNVTPVKFDPERAKKLMAEAGFPEGKNFPPVKIAHLAPFRNEAAYYVDQWKKVLGVEIEIDIMERGLYLRSLNAGEVPLFAWGWTAGYPDALYFLSQVWHSTSPYNRAKYANPEFDRLIDQAQVTPDDAQRYRLYNQAERVLLDDWGTCGIVVQTHVATIKPNVKGVTLTPMRFLPFGDVTIE